MSITTPQLMTAEEFWLLSGSEQKSELVRGEVIETMLPGGLHGAIALQLGALLRLWAKAEARGVVGVESGFVLGRDPNTVRGPDLFFVAKERMPPEGIPEAFWQQAPDLAVEIVSPSESAEDVRAKVRDFLAAGTALVWVVYPRSREVLVHRPGCAIEVLAEADTLEDAAVLPGFACRVDELFA
ncbi:MAG: Uma2 family endonuclease [Candidatus Viridilinea halotolerans]|uniref:Uma2 family endonuclease n=1 Tax=Candidatus Viridilinea halotolerans TaxID=2491704 RepID=A0A426U0L7_9CHLR|nr:MAG: Uma2 family endonuclease [Candidatus Viridilinea halotolerans]